MTRNSKITKLANAVREYRGSFHPDTKKWIKPPVKQKIAQIKVWLERLHIDVQPAISRIDGFKSFPEFNEWLRGLSSE